jgi:pyruvate dehydrogenase E1 component beta subunit
VTHTRRLVAVEEGPPQGGYAAEVIALALEEAGPIAARRVTMPGLPIPFAPTLEKVALPDSDDVAAAARALVGG